jgi:hypothetical protein
MNASVITTSVSQLIDITAQIRALTEQKKMIEELVFSDHGEDKKSISVPGHGRVNIIAESISESLDLVSSLAQILDIDLAGEKSRKEHLAIIETSLAAEGLATPKKVTIRKASIRVTVNS